MSQDQRRESALDAGGAPSRRARAISRWMQGGLLLLCAALLVIDVVHEAHGHFAFEEWFGFHALFGFVAYMTIVNSAKLLRRLVERPEDYYDR